MQIDLTRSAWQLYGYRPNYFHERRSVDHTGHYQPQWGPVPATVPSSAQTALRKANLIPDWNVGTNSLLCEWVEHYQWEFRTKLASLKLAPGQRAILHCDGLDYSGWIAIDHKIVADFKGALVRHRFDLTDHLADGKPHILSILFHLPPAEQGQVGATSQSRFFKPRFSYSWDWCPRFVPIGIWDRLRLDIDSPKPEIKRITTSLDENLSTGAVSILIDNPTDSAEICIELRRAGRPLASSRCALQPGEQTVTLDVENVEPWYPSGAGKQPLYDLIVTSADNKPLHRATIGFKRITWQHNPGVSPAHSPMLCHVNGNPIFLQGVNWTPIRMDYHHIPDAEYKKRIALYKKMGCNVLRVWGGAYLERDIFYRLCDEAGLLVWQEFPLSSSGPDNYAPTDPQAITDLTTIARDYIRRRAHHACKLLWCGGNELQSLRDANGREFPLTDSHPALAAMKKIVEQEDPHTRFLPTSPSGPVFYATPESVGKNTALHVHVHGPWNHTGPLQSAFDYWKSDDANFRSETGMPGLSPLSLIQKYAGNLNPWPPTRDNPLWSHTSLWWLPTHLITAELNRSKPHAALKKLIEQSQRLQSQILQLAAQSCKSRFPTCSGFMIWMGHDAFPTPSNTSIIDFDGRPKRAYHAVAKIFRAPAVSSVASTQSRSTPTASSPPALAPRKKSKSKPRRSLHS